MSAICEVLEKKKLPSYLAPLFWQHGESEGVLREEIRQMHENGIGGFIVESRPHPGFLKEEWWRDLDILLEEAGKREMKVWIFDDNAYPSGYCAGLIKEKHPEYLKVYLAESHVDAVGPLCGSSFLIKAWLVAGESLVRVVAARRTDGLEKIDGESLTDLTSRLDNGILYWDVPEGHWRIFILKKTRNGGEEWTKDYLNPLDPQAVQAYIDYVYEGHYKRYGHHFGKTIAGFFSDEPRFGNAATYEGAIGRFPMVLPWWDRLLPILEEEWGGDFGTLLPCLWGDAGETSAKARYAFMNVVSRLYGQHMTGQLGDWCRAHGVKLIGHVVEDNGAHARLGYGSGHFFRALRGQDCSGMDLVYQVWPEYNSGRFTTPFGYLDANFFYWGLAKLASSEGHIDPKKQGTTVCEIFGAFGWQEGLKLMKWLTDFVCVRGVNVLIPHAFSPKYRDPDCPPHFYARGENPQWKYFHILARYTNRICHLLSGGVHVAPAAVVYHAEAEWSGAHQPFEDAVRILSKQQIDCDVLPADTLIDQAETRLEKGRLKVNLEAYQTVVVPYSQHIPSALALRLLEFAQAGVPVMFLRDWPTESCEQANGFVETLEALKGHENCFIVKDEELADRFAALGLEDIRVADCEENLRYYHYRSDKEELYFFTNESKYRTIRTKVSFREARKPVLYDAMSEKLHVLDYAQVEDRTEVMLQLEPYESCFVIFMEDGAKYELADRIVPVGDEAGGKCLLQLEDGWTASVQEAGDCGPFKPEPRITGVGNISKPGCLPEFSGTIRYETQFVIEGAWLERKLFLDLGEAFEIADVRVNGQLAGVRICPPYRFEMTGLLKEGVNRLNIEVTNTLAKKFGSNGFDRAMPQEPSGLIGPVRMLECGAAAY